MSAIHGNNINEINFHHVLKDIENFFWFLILSNAALANPFVQNEIKKQNEPNILSMLEKFNQWTCLQTEINHSTNQYKTNMKPLGLFILCGKLMAINCYELLKASNYYSSLKDTIEFKFLYHIRNGAAHNNKFHFKNSSGKWTLTESEIIQWDCYKICRNLQDNPVFNEFIDFSNIFRLGVYFSEKLKNIDENKK
ncbi:MAG: hypothetical protein AAB653_03090 [Patescibacteria group bacterium]